MWPENVSLSSMIEEVNQKGTGKISAERLTGAVDERHFTAETSQ